MKNNPQTSRPTPSRSQAAPIASDAVNHPKHYNSHPSGIECITIVRHLCFNLGNAVKYIWRAGLKSSVHEVEDLEKAIFYLRDEIKLRREQAGNDHNKVLR